MPFTVVYFVFLWIGLMGNEQVPFVQLNNEINATEVSIELSRIEFTGNKKTKAKVLYNFLGLKPKKLYSADFIQEKVHFLYALNGIFSVSHTLTKLDDGSFLLSVHVEEQITTLPIVSFGLQQTNKWLQLGFVDLNVLGTGNELLFYYINNQGRHGGNAFFKWNRIKGKPINMGVNALSWNSIEPVRFDNSTPFDYYFTLTQLGNEWTYIYKNRASITGGLSYLNEQYKSVSLTSPGPALLQLNKIFSNVRIGYSTLEYESIYRNNYEIHVDYQHVYTIEENQNFNFLRLDYRYFKKIQTDAEVALKFSGGISSNFDSPFAPFVIDSYQNVRGVGDRVLRGTGILCGSIEWRKEVVTYKKIILQGVVFSDFATLRLPGNEWTFNSQYMPFFNSVGLGTRLHYTKIYNAIFRIDYGYEYIQKSGQLLIGIGHFF